MTHVTCITITMCNMYSEHFKCYHKLSPPALTVLPGRILPCRNHQAYVQETKDKTRHNTRKGLSYREFSFLAKRDRKVIAKCTTLVSVGGENHVRSHIVLYLIEVFMSRVVAYEPLVRSQHLLFLVCRRSEVGDPPKSYTYGIGTVHPTL